MSILQQVKALAVDWLGPLYGLLFHAYHTVFPFFGQHVLNGLFVASALLLALGLYWHNGRAGSERSWRGAWRFLAPKEVLWHPSARVDYRFYLVNSVLFAYVNVGARVAGVVGLLQVADGVAALLADVLGRPAQREQAPGLAARIAFSIFLVLALDFAKFFAHYLQHRVKLLWEFHKVHHSAEVLTPLTNFRLHPVDVILEQVLAALASGVVVGVFEYRYPGGVAELTIMNIGVIYFVYFLAANLRHSHIPLHFGWGLSHVFSSPYMHQLHHSSEARHWDRNYGLVFSFWDALFRCLYVPRGPETYRLGLAGPRTDDFDKAWKLYVMPFRNAWRRIVGSVSPVRPEPPRG